MKKEYASLGLSILAIILSVITLCISKATVSELGLDYLGIIIGILALLVTVLIGWQIFSLINIKEIEKNIENQMFQSQALLLVKTSRLELIRYRCSKLTNKYAFGKYLDCILEAIFIYYKLEDYNKCNMLIDDILVEDPFHDNIQEFNSDYFISYISPLKDHPVINQSNLDRLIKCIESRLG